MERGIILVEYIPDFCCTCDYASNEICRINERDIDVDPYTDRPEWCPIKPLSKEVEMQLFREGKM